MELQDHYDAITALDTEVVAIAALERDPALLERISGFVRNGFPLLADPRDEVAAHFEMFGAYVADKQGVLRSFVPGTKDARPRLDMVIAEVARVAGRPAPPMRREFGKVVVAPRGRAADRVAGAGRDAAAGSTGDALPSVISLRWMWSHDAVRPGDELKLALLPEIAPGWHVYAHDEARMTPFTVDLELPEGLALARPLAHPPGSPTRDPVLDVELSMHTGDVPMPAVVLAASDDLAPGELLVTARISHQACGEGRCLPPATTTVELPLTARARGTERGQVYGWQGW